MMPDDHSQPKVQREDLPYRHGVGIALFNKDGKVLIARRFHAANSWQMPQGGRGHGETDLQAAFRELYEEVGVPKDAVVLLEEMKETLTYDLPDKFVGKAWHGRFRGQEQRWFAMRLVAGDDVIRLDVHHHREFDEWRWEDLHKLPDIITSFKRSLYEAVVAAFTQYATPQT